MSWWIKHQIRQDSGGSASLCCAWLFEATFDCNTLTWGVVLISSTPDELCDIDTAWVVTGDPLVYRKTDWTQPGTCDVEPDPGEPFDGGIPPGSGCLCCRWDFEATWDCDTELWTVTMVGNEAEVACEEDTDWTEDPESPGTFTRSMWTVPDDCSGAEPDPGEPEATDLCCCRWVYEATWDCDSGVWNVVLESSDVNVLCDDDTDWDTTEDACVYTRTLYTSGMNCSSEEPDPGEPLGGEPVGCCIDPCECISDDLLATATAICSGAGCGNACGDSGVWTFTTAGTDGDDCYWRYSDGESTTLEVRYDTVTELWSATLDTSGCVAGDADIDVECVPDCGLTGTVNFSGCDCGGDAFDISFTLECEPSCANCLSETQATLTALIEDAGGCGINASCLDTPFNLTFTSFAHDGDNCVWTFDGTTPAPCSGAVTMTITWDAVATQFDIEVTGSLQGTLLDADVSCEEGLFVAAPGGVDIQLSGGGVDCNLHIAGP